MNKKVLLVADDDSMNRKIINRFLKDEFTIIEAENGEETLNLLKANHVDLMLLDIIMPKLDGLEVLKAIQEAGDDFSRVGVLVATSTKEKTERAALALGADDVVAKPYDPIVIKKRLENIVDVKEMQMQRRQLLSSDIDGLVDDKLISLKGQVGQLSAQLKKSAELINSNAENMQLVRELAMDLYSNVDKIQDLLK